MMSISQKIRTAVVQTYIMARHPEAIQLKRKGISYEHYRDLKKPWILDLNIKTILDIGANKGQFARLAREVFADAAIYSFEPLPDCFAELRAALPGDQNFFPFENAIGSKEETLEFFRSFHTPSSSFLKMEELHKEAFPESQEGQSAVPTIVQVKTLDGVLGDKKLEKNILVKIDVQGFEMEAIEGAKGVLADAKIAILEMSFLNIYENQPLFHDVYEKMYNLGFRFRGSLAQMLHPITEEIVQTDAIFVKEN
jgi:FkbM family methyltransferase